MRRQPRPPRTPPCETAFDLTLVLDRSWSMRTNMAELKSLAKSIVRQLTLGLQRVAVVSFSRTASLDIALSDCRSCFEAAVDKLEVSGDTNINDALEVAYGGFELMASPNGTIVPGTIGPINRQPSVPATVPDEILG